MDGDCTVNDDTTTAPVRSRRGLGATLVALAVALGGCATSGTPGGGGAASPLPPNAEPPPPNVNLSGFPLPYRQGYADGVITSYSIHYTKLYEMLHVRKSPIVVRSVLPCRRDSKM